MEKSIPLSTRFSDWVVPQILSAGCFGSSCKIISCGVDPNRKGEDQFSSTVQFFELKLRVKNDLHTKHVVVKFLPQRESWRAKGQFQNEIITYSEILPLIDKDGIIEEIFPKYYHGLSSLDMNDESDYVLLEDLSKMGYRLTDEKVFLDYDHCILVLEGIGKFHALSYAAKRTKNSQFKALISKLKNKWSNKDLIEHKYIFLFCGQRGILPLIKKQIQPHLLREFLKNYEDPIKFYSNLTEPLEPEAVLCHGDFCRNNMLFAYNDERKPVSVKFFDLQTPRYSSPVIDLSFFLLMNTSKATREKYWGEFIDVYKKSVKSVIPDIDIPNLDFKRYSIYGYIHCSFFLPMMMADRSKRLTTDEEANLSWYEIGSEFSRIGGEVETEVLVDIIKFLLSKGYICEKYF